MKLFKAIKTPLLGAMGAVMLSGLTTFGAGVQKYVEYVESDGVANSSGEYVLLDYTPTSSSVVEMDFALGGGTEENACLFCARGSSYNDNTFSTFYIKGQGLRWDYCSNASGPYQRLDKTDQGRHTLRVSNGGLWLDGTKAENISVKPQAFTPANRMMLFASYQCQPTETPAATGNYASIKLYRFRAWDNDGATLKVDLRPCVDTDGAIGLCDAVSSKIYYNLKDGKAFTASETEIAYTDTLIVTATPEEYGTVTPAYGPHEISAGELTFTAPEGEQADGEDVRYTVVGWERTVSRAGADDVVTTGSGASCTVMHEADTRETFRWKIVKTPLLNVKRVAQRYPWNGLVDIDYAVCGFTGVETDYRLEVTAHAGGRDIPCRHFMADSAGDLPVVDGVHHIVWDASQDAPDLRADDVTVTLDLQYAPITETMADYIIIDLSGGPTAATHPVRFVKGDIPATAYNNPTYKTTKLVMKKVKAGVYTVGDNYLNSDAATGDLVKRSVIKLTHDYFLGIFEVTQRQYELVTGKQPSGCKIPNDKVAEDEIGMRPNEQVVWNNLAVNEPTFASLLNEKTRYRTHALANFSLPTETQWEVACRAGTLTAYYWGKDETNAADYEWYGDGQNPITVVHQTDVVGRRKPNGWGFYDMLGNVTEFCLDFNYVYPQGTEEEPVVDPRGPESGLSVIVRGSNFQTTLRNSGSRVDVAPNSVITYSGHMYGFRIAKTCP